MDDRLEEQESEQASFDQLVSFVEQHGGPLNWQELVELRRLALHFAAYASTRDVMEDR